MAGQRPRAQRFPAACTFLFGASRPKSPVYIQQPQRPTRQSPNAFCSFGFPDAKTRSVYFFSIQNHRFRLDRPISPTANPLSIPAIQPQQDSSFHSGASRPTPSCPTFLQSPTLPDRQHIPFRRQPANISRRPSFHTGPHNPKPANSIPPGLAGRRLISLPTTFLTSTKHHLPTKYRSTPFFKNPPIAIFPNILPAHLRHLYITIPFFHTSSFFYFLYCRQHPSGFRLSVSPTPISSYHSPNVLHFFRPAAASPTRRPNAKRSFARGCSLQGCRWCGRGARVSFFFFLFLFLSASLFSLSFLISLAPRLRRDAFIFLFAFLHIFVFYFCFFLFVLIFTFLFAFFFLFLF